MATQKIQYCSTLQEQRGFNVSKTMSKLMLKKVTKA